MSDEPEIRLVNVAEGRDEDDYRFLVRLPDVDVLFLKEATASDVMVNLADHWSAEACGRQEDGHWLCRPYTMCRLKECPLNLGADA